MTTVAIVFAPLTLGAMLFLLPLLFRPEFAVHSCRRCGLRLAITTTGMGDYAFTIAADVADRHFAPAEDGWRPDLARLPGGLRVARSPLGPRPEITEKAMKTCSSRFVDTKARSRIQLISDDWKRGTVRCMVADGDDRLAAGARDRQGDVFCEIHLNNVDELGSYTNSEPNIQVTMRTDATIHGQAAPNAPQMLPSYTAAHNDDTPVSEFTETCRIRLFPGDNYSASFQLPSSNPPSYSSPSSSSSPGPPTVNVSPVTKRFRTMFWGGMPIWRWKSSEGNLMWVSRRFRDADMSALATTLCLVDDYERLVAAVEGWESRRNPSAAPASTAVAGEPGSMVRECTMKVYADLDAGVLGEILGSYCVLLAQVRRASKVLKREDDEKRSSS